MKKNLLKIAKEVSLPLDIVTNTIAILAKRRAGKSYTMRKLVEQLFEANQQLILVDPKGDQWGIRSSADGKKPGLPIVILGGEHGDAPLEPSSGEVVANLVVKERVSILIDLSTFRKHEVATFMTAFLENLYRLKAKEEYRTPCMLVIDEADAIAPQKPQKGEERMLGAAEDIVRRGGQRGIGCALITQRSAVLNKNVLTQAQMLIVLRTIAPQDLTAMKAWIDVHGDEKQGKTLMDSLPSLPIGDAWFWSPGWPTDQGIFKRAHVLPIETFDSGATPAPGETKIIPKNLADVDLEALKVQMVATIEKAKKEDPKLLQKRIDELTKMVDKKFSQTLPPIKTETKVVEVPAFKDSQITRLEKIFGDMKKEAEKHGKAMSLLWSNFDQIADALQKAFIAIKEQKKHSDIPSHNNPPGAVMKGVVIKEVEKLPIGTLMTIEKNISNAQQKIIDTLRWTESVGIYPTDKTQLALLVGARPTSGGYANNLGGLRSQGLISYPQPGTAALTPEGKALSNEVSVPSTSEELHEQLFQKMSGAQKKILEFLISIYPNQVTKTELAGALGVQETSGGYANNLGSLRSLGLVSYPVPGSVKAEKVLFIQ